MDDPATTVKAHANSATAQRLSHRAAPGLNVSRTTVDVLTCSSSTDTTIVLGRSIATDDPERLPPSRRPNALQDLEELRRRIQLRSAPVLGEL